MQKIVRKTVQIHGAILDTVLQWFRRRYKLATILLLVLLIVVFILGMASPK